MITPQTEAHAALVKLLRDCGDYLSDIPESAVGGDDYARDLCRRIRAALPVERKLAPEWKELREDSWEGAAGVWVLDEEHSRAWLKPWATAYQLTAARWRYWQPATPPRVYEDEGEGT